MTTSCYEYFPQRVLYKSCNQSYSLVLDTSTPLTMPAMIATRRLTVPTTMKKPHLKIMKPSAPVTLYEKMFSKCAPHRRQARSIPSGEKSLEVSDESSDSEVSKMSPPAVDLYEDEFFIQMMRPKEICSDPQFYVDCYSRFDVTQGELGDCWFLAVLANLTENKNLFSQVVPEGQSFDGEEYVGMFRFRFWKFGEWVEVVIDDRLPTVNGDLIYLRSLEVNEFWSPLFEKAYSKFRGTTYQTLEGGYSCVAMQDLTGGLTEYYDMTSLPVDFFTILLQGYEKKALITCSTEEDANKEKNIVGLHSYSVNKVLNLTTDTGVVQLLRIRNPWGSSEWNGAWSDQSAEWTSIDEDKRKKLGLVVNDDGEFWMCYEDFIKHFSDVQLCHLSSDSPDPENKLNMASIKGKWIKGITAGGCQDVESFCCNPQYMFTLSEPDKGNTENLCEIIVGLTQKQIPDEELLNISFAIYTIDDTNPQKPFDCNYFENSCPEIAFSKDREYSVRYSLNPGSHVIIPYTEDPDQERDFLLCIMSEKNIEITKYDGDLRFEAVEDRVKTFPSVGADLSLNLFNSLANPDGNVDCKQLKEILDFVLRLELGDQKFTEELCQKIIMRSGRSDELSFEEFKSLWAQLREWHAAFSVCEKDFNNTIPRRKLRAALRAAGWIMDMRGLESLSNRFNLTEDNINFYEFINCILEVNVMIDENQKASQSGFFAASDNEETPDVENETEDSAEI